jgi:type IV pilus biogenesis protein CpaD/CtpE
MRGLPVKNHLLALAIFGLCACASTATAPSGTVARAQQDYNLALEKCQDDYRWDVSPDAGLSAASTEDDAKFSQCVAPAKATLDADMRHAEGNDARAVADAGSGV